MTKMRWFWLDDTGRGASREDGGHVVSAVLAIGALCLVVFFLYFVLVRLGSVVRDAIARTRQ
jgi:hypothetical protein